MWAKISVDLVFTDFSSAKSESVISFPTVEEGSVHSSLFLSRNKTVICILEAVRTVAKMTKGPVNPPGYMCIISMLRERI